MPVDLESLNAEQRQAVLLTEGPVLVLAGPGSGKTRVTTTRVAHLVDLGHDPAGIVAITFTNKAAAEMRHRVAKLLPGARIHEMWVQTFHSMCLRILKASEHLLDVGRFSIYDEDAVKSLFRGVLRDLDLTAHPLARAFRSEVSNAKNNLVGTGDFLSTAETENERTIALVYQEYHDRLRAQHGYDFDDLIFETVRLLENHPTVREQYQRHFHHVHVDEYQDTNHAQYRLTSLLSGPNIMAVGDDDQSIYGFRGSDPKHIKAFLKDRPDTVVIPLGQNYRSTSRIVAVSSALVSKNRGRSSKDLRTENQLGSPVLVHGAPDEKAEAQFVTDAILQLLKAGREPGDFAILYRTGAQSRVIETYLVRRGIPYKVVKGTTFFDRSEVKDTMAILRMAAGGNDLSLSRVLTSPTMPKRGIGKGTLQRMVNKGQEEGISLEEAFREAYATKSFPKSKHTTVGALLGLLDELRQVVSQETELALMVSRVIQKFGITEALLGTQEGEERIQNVLEIANLAAEFNDGQEQESGLLEFLDWLTLVQGEFIADSKGRLTSAPPANAVSLMTAHASKGLEFPVVFLVGVEEDLLPHFRATFGEPDQISRAVEEERRLAYVAMTRAQRVLCLTFAARRTVNGKTLMRRSSRFLEDLPQEHLKRTGRTAAAPARPWERWD